MGELPQLAKLFLNVKEQVIKIFNRNNLPVIIAISAAIAGYSLTFSFPTFHSQAFDEKMGEIKLSFREIQSSKNDAIPENKADNSQGIFLSDKKNEFEKELYAIVGDYPIKEMIPYIAQKDKTVAAFIVGIAKKESNWGKRVPTLNGQNCFNYWGYKGAGKNGIAMGHGCFATPEEAVDVISKRLEQLVEKNLTTPSKMVVWKCGSSCAATGGQAAANKWISDVSFYFNKIVKKDA